MKMTRFLAMVLSAALLSACTIPAPYIPVPPPTPIPVPIPPPIVPDADVVSWEKLQEVIAKAKTEALTEAQLDAMLGKHVKPDPYVQVREPFHKITTYAVKSSDGKRALRVYVHTLNGKLVLPVEESIHVE